MANEICWGKIGPKPRWLHWRLRMVAGACNHPNCLVLPFSVELIRLAA